MNKGKLIFTEDFNYEGKPDEKIWTFETGPWRPNNELEYYTDRIENCYVKDSCLHIVARKEEFEERHYTSARLKTRYKFDMLYGVIEVRAKVPSGKGSWPAIWMMATEEKYGGWPRSGEIDIMEHVGSDDFVQSVLHTEGYNHRNHKERIGFYKNYDENAFHNFTLEWREDYMKFYVDDNLFYEVHNDHKDEGYQAWPFTEKFYLILNLAIGGFLGGKHGIDDDAFPMEFVIDYIKAYE